MKSRQRRRVLAAALLAALAVWLGAAFMAPAADGRATVETPPAGSEAGVLVTAPPPEPPDAPTAAAEPTVATASAAGAPLPTCEYASLPAPLAGLAEWQYTLLDTTYRLDPNYAPPDLVSLPTALAHVAPGAYLAADGHQLRAAAAAGLVALFEAAKAADIHLAVQSAYRSYAYQESTFASWVQLDGYDAALRTSARAGHSEHQLGTAVDLRSRGGPPAWDLADWASTPEGAWVQANAHRYGFVMSYPAGEEHRSCYAYEPWHYRYVGPELATAIHETGEPPRVFLWQHVQMVGATDAQADEESQ